MRFCPSDLDSALTVCIQSSILELHGDATTREDSMGEKKLRHAYRLWASFLARMAQLFTTAEGENTILAPLETDHD